MKSKQGLTTMIIPAKIQNMYFKIFNKYFTLGVYKDKNVWYNNPMYFKKLKKFFKKYL